MEGVCVLVDVAVGTTTVNEGVNVVLGVSDGVDDDVGEGVMVADAVNVTGWNGVNVCDGVEVLVAVKV
jgi:hypothetical protein